MCGKREGTEKGKKRKTRRTRAPKGAHCPSETEEPLDRRFRTLPNPPSVVSATAEDSIPRKIVAEIKDMARLWRADGSERDGGGAAYEREEGEKVEGGGGRQVCVSITEVMDSVSMAPAS
ncbi:hypothetical protein HAX54_020999 [Datura stramonium]|uniref:Uncharacterized protein n=1 Tax=Datura stramonium TaxID=4076 RepID=A0ABS8S349_DATST|nr:hypothetical protein [Datura stramonium]